jgi:hypothetical protein
MTCHGRVELLALDRDSSGWHIFASWGPIHWALSQRPVWGKAFCLRVQCFYHDDECGEFGRLGFLFSVRWFTLTLSLGPIVGPECFSGPSENGLQVSNLIRSN